MEAQTTHPMTQCHIPDDRNPKVFRTLLVFCRSMFFLGRLRWFWHAQRMEENRIPDM